MLSDYYARIVIDPQGRINLQQLLRQPAAKTATTTAPAAPTAQQARLEFGPISFVNGQVDFADHFIRPNYSARLSELSGSLGGFSNQNDENGFHLSVKRWLLRHEGATAAPWQQQSIWP